MTSDEKIREIAYKTAETVQGYLKDNEGWHVALNDNGVIVEYKHSVCPGYESGYLYKCQAEFNCPKETVFKYIDINDGDKSLRLKWDKDMKSCRVLRRIDENITLQTSMTNSAAKGLISSRDFINVNYVKKADDFVSSNSASIETDEFPPIDKIVRGFNYPCGFYCLSTPDKPNVTKLITFIQTDLKGMLPRALIDAAIPKSMVTFFSSLETSLKEDGHLS